MSATKKSRKPAESSLAPELVQAIRMHHREQIIAVIENEANRLHWAGRPLLARAYSDVGELVRELHASGFDLDSFKPSLKRQHEWQRRLDGSPEKVKPLSAKRRKRVGRK